MRRRAGIALLFGGLSLVSSCGTGFKLPNEVRRENLASDGKYTRLDTWTGFVGVTDLLLTKSINPINEQLYVLFDAHTPGSTAKLVAYTLATPTVIPYNFQRLQNPVAVCGNSSRIFVLDQGDSAAARLLRPSNGRHDSTIAFFDKTWRVREYFPDGGDTLTTFTDTTMSWVQGIAVDDAQRIYVSGLYILVTVNSENPFYFYRRFVWRIFRYVRGAGDNNMPGCNWHRDPSYVVEEGSGLGTAADPRGLDWNPGDGGALFIADTGNNRAQRRSDPTSSSDYLMLDTEKGGLRAPVDITSDLAGFAYVADQADSAVYRFTRSAELGIGQFVQRVDLEPTAEGFPLRRPVAVAADNELVYVADGGRSEIAVFKRRK